jgi:hypothetical protein
MLDNHAALLALRNRLLTTVVATTGSTTLASTVDGFTRTTGSFVDDGFVPGMEVTPFGFTDNSSSILKTVAPTVVTVQDFRLEEPPTPGVSLTVGVPTIRGWINKEIKPDIGAWRIKEMFQPGAGRVEGLGSFVWIHYHPSYMVTFHGPDNSGALPMMRMMDSILGVFPPMLPLVLAGGVVLRVRSTVVPFASELLNDENGQAYIVVTVPLWVRTQNTI